MHLLKFTLGFIFCLSGRLACLLLLFEKEKACKSTINRMAVVKRTAEATRLSERTIRDIHKEHVAHDGQLLTPVKRYTTSRIRINPDTFDREAIRRLVHADGSHGW